MLERLPTRKESLAEQSPDPDSADMCSLAGRGYAQLITQSYENSNAFQ